MIQISEKVKLLSNSIAIKATNEAEYFPVDRKFLAPYILEISQLNPLEFILYNLEQVNPTYTTQLFLCLPELWENIETESLLYITKSFTNTFSFYTLILFTYKYLEIDILRPIIETAKAMGFYDAVKQYLQNQWNVIIKSPEERFTLEEEIEKEYFGYDKDQWNYLKQRLMLDKRAEPALIEYDGLESYIKSIAK